MSDKPPQGPSHQLRSALDRVLVHDIKNMGFRLQMLLSNVDEHYGDPEFKRAVQEAAKPGFKLCPIEASVACVFGGDDDDDDD